MTKKNSGQHNPIHRNYEETIAAAKKRSYQVASQKTKDLGEARRRVETLMEQRAFERETGELA